MKKRPAVWIVIQIVHNETRAKEIQDRLTGEGFMVRLRAVSGEVASGEQVYEVLSLSSEANEARSLLIDLGL